MAQRDYVKKKAKPKNKSRIIPNLMMAIAVILVILFVAILYFVSTNKSNKPVTPTSNVTEKPQVTLPDKPEERWTYLKELENPEGNQSSTNSQVKPSEQEKERQQILDSFMNDKPQINQAANQTTTASTTTDKVNQTQQNTTQTNSTVPSSNWLLQCGAFKDKANAESLKARLTMLGITSFIKSEKFHRVLAGPYNSKPEAEKAIASLKSDGISSCITTQK